MSRRRGVGLVPLVGTTVVAVCMAWVVPVAASPAGEPDSGLPPKQEVWGVTAVAPDDAWAVGYEGSLGNEGSFTALARHWDGATWQSYEPFVGSGDSLFSHVDADASGDVWAVGGISSDNPDDGLLTVHWDGKQWVRVPVDIELHRSRDAYLTGLSVVGPDDVWAVGQAEISDFVMHWDGVSWKRVHAPFRGRRFLAITAISASDVWLGGGRYVNGRTSSFTEHWDGTDWTPVPNPDPKDANFGADIQIRSLSGPSASDVWAVGDYYLAAGNHGAFIEHWDGSRWKLFRDGDNPVASYLASVSADSSTDAWAGGLRFVAGAAQPYLLHWDGHHWTEVMAASPRRKRTVASVSADSPTEAWAVGGLRGTQALVQRWDGSRWQQAP